MKYEDPIISHFKTKELIDKDDLKRLIEEQKQKNADNTVSVGRGSSNRQDLATCEGALSVYTDLIKLKFLLQKSWELQTLVKSVLIRFDIQGVGLTREERTLNHSEDFYKDIALKTISKCEKLSKSLEQLSLDSQRIVDYIQSVCAEDISHYLSDTICLLLEMWFLCGKVSRQLKRNVAGLFIRAKVLLIDYELEIIRQETPELDSEDYSTFKETVKSYRSFIKIFLQQLQDSELSQNHSQFEECLHVFLDIESMYSAMNFNWLLIDGKSMHTDLDDIQDSYVDVGEDMEELNNINGFVDKIVDKEEDDDLAPLQKLPNTQSPRRFSESSSTSDISLMMERTSLSKELPNLLQAFNNAKKLEQELENVRNTSNSSRESTPVGSPLVGLSSSALTSSTFSPSSSILLSSTSKFEGESPFLASPSNSMILEVTSSNYTENIGASGHLPPTPLSQLDMSSQLIRNDILRMMKNQNPSKYAYNRKINGFGSNVLNSLYGIGDKR
ncbi:LAFE_0D09582g1_1 [Lachancea fermentati]|uniref:LAFE_0D09582g1_1 n=1 Tax=Lachancea fermentati TaxID=4955 RepID=A0A1G4MBR1_LACFM|nr:LAFE_0D09582g1_1 [Lachancea fermentati]